MEEFNYDIHKYIAYRKKQRDEAGNDKKWFIVEIKREENLINELKKENKLLKKENRELKSKNEVMRNIINSYENECKLSDNAKKCIHDIERRLFNEEN